MRRNRDKKPLLDFDPKPERTFRRRLQQARLCKAAESTMDPNNAANANMANPNGNEQQRRVLGSYFAPTAYLYGKSIVVPPIAANNFELKPQLVTLVQQNCQYYGLPQEDPNQFISNFLQICDTVKTNRVNPEVYKLMLFPFALRDGAKLWLDSQSKESLDTWDKVVTEFLTKFFPPKKLTKLRVEVQTFRQKDGETLYEAWERYKLLTRQCPPDMFSQWTQLDIFYEGLGEMSKMCLDNSAGGSLHKKKTPEETIELIELVGFYVVLVTVLNVELVPSWWYKSCVYSMKAEANADTYFCDGCNKDANNVDDKYKLDLLNFNGTATTIFVVFDKEIATLFEWTCTEIVKELNKKGEASKDPTSFKEFFLNKEFLFKVEVETSGWCNSYDISMISSDPTILARWRDTQNPIKSGVSLTGPATHFDIDDFLILRRKR
ncbi:hypothetical protein AHAS_Ahas19G0131000 [Arachis hypogaea]